MRSAGGEALRQHTVADSGVDWRCLYGVVRGAYGDAAAAHPHKQWLRTMCTGCTMFFLSSIESENKLGLGSGSRVYRECAKLPVHIVHTVQTSINISRSASLCPRTSPYHPVPNEGQQCPLIILTTPASPLHPPQKCEINECNSPPRISSPEYYLLSGQPQYERKL
jgi:hypothetical protein